MESKSKKQKTDTNTKTTITFYGLQNSDEQDQFNDMLAKLTGEMPKPFAEVLHPPQNDDDDDNLFFPGPILEQYITSINDKSNEQRGGIVFYSTNPTEKYKKYKQTFQQIVNKKPPTLEQLQLEFHDLADYERTRALKEMKEEIRIKEEKRQKVLEELKIKTAEEEKKAKAAAVAAAEEGLFSAFRSVLAPPTEEQKKKQETRYDDAKATREVLQTKISNITTRIKGYKTQQKKETDEEAQKRLDILIKEAQLDLKKLNEQLGILNQEINTYETPDIVNNMSFL